ncbi:MAG: hypothetical protein HXN00_09430 [Porphyromonadaceae bacterium]|mgnify:FL=1|nr:hypothetical protein [Porphyromonadaceae bacterium]DAF12222.1 MAG TPA: hypothetical protein [Caudoviricetes sp.]DAN01581.1 MAG TPA: hypothetical protein [Caudoviricetes sp.]DAN77409.1 MAG TPA: hypothetical protein [Caudoviricetes sp.]DAW67109.1 MAG TPA: hypothetical protein [Caudoviricetes sp.]
MAKFFGEIGFATQVETSPGIWEDKIIEKQYYGDITRESRRFSASEQVLDNINLSNQVSIIADGYVTDNIQNLRYVRWLGGLWKISYVELKFPRLVLEMTGVYNGPTP